MKKLAFFFIILVGLIVIAGCSQTRKSVTRFSTDKSGKTIVEEVKNNGPTTTITKVDNGDKAELEPIDIPVKTDGEDVEFAVTSMEESVMETDKGYHFIEGTTPSSTVKIAVNGYELNKYKPGNTKWNYIAAVALGTLRQGENNYTIQAFDANGDEIDSENFSIVYSGIEAGKLVPTGNGLTLTLILTIIGTFGFYAIRKRFVY